MSMGQELARRRALSLQRATELQTRLEAGLGTDFERLVGDHTCIYATGSLGRLELSATSDLDVFIARTSSKEPSNLDAVLLQAALIRVQKELAFPAPSQDGGFLKMHSERDLIEKLGEPRDDDGLNTFTARMLLLLESRPILGLRGYERILESVLGTYWTDTKGHEQEYLPILLVNDTVRYWRNLQLNYQARKSRLRRRREEDKHNLPASSNSQEAERIHREYEVKWRLLSAKLRFARCLTCYASLAWLLAEVRRTQRATGSKGLVSLDAARRMVKLTPFDRLLEAASVAAFPHIRRFESEYEWFLGVVAQDKDAFAGEPGREAIQRGNDFGDLVFELVQVLGQDNPLYRYLVV